MTTTHARTRLGLLALLAAAVGVLLCSVPAGAATNLAPNPGFELSCFGAPCSWGGAWSNVNPHSGAASNKLTETQSGAFSFAVASECVPATSATYSLSAWYRTADPTITFVAFAAVYYPSADCTGIGTNPGGATGSVTPQHGWLQISAAASSPAGTQSAILVLSFGCSTGCANLATGNFDDLHMEAQPPTAVAFESVAAARTSKGLLLRWRTVSEASMVGFNVYRQIGAGRVRVNARLIPAGTSVSGQRYSFLDRRAPARAARYWIQAVETDGSSGWLGPVLVRRGGHRDGGSG